MEEIWNCNKIVIQKSPEMRLIFGDKIMFSFCRKLLLAATSNE